MGGNTSKMPRAPALQKKSQRYNTEYHSVSFSTIGPLNSIAVGLNGTLSGNLKQHAIPLNGTKNPTYHSNTIQIPFKYPWP